MVSRGRRYWRAGRDGLGREVRFCWSSHRNVAGYFLTWREVIGKSGFKRSQFSAHRSRKACRAMAERRREAWVLLANREASLNPASSPPRIIDNITHEREA